MKKHLFIREARLSDLEAVYGLVQMQMTEHHIPANGRLEKAVRQVLADQTYGFILVAEIAGEIVGFTYISLIWSLEHAGLSAWMDELFVLPEQRNRGIGQQLIDASMQACEDRKLRAIDLEVEHGHEDVVRLYQRNDFRPHRRLRFYRILRRQQRDKGADRERRAL